MKLLTIIGARPQFVKAGIVSLKLKIYPSVQEIIVHTGQHFDNNMSSVFFSQLQIPQPRHNLNINSLNHGAMTGRMIESIENIILEEKPDYCMVYGDTNSTIAGALASKKLNVGVIHVEAGLRSFNMKMPEEINRILTDRISDILFCPTDTALHNLKNEGFDNFKSRIIKSGDVMQDAAIHFSKQKPADISRLLPPVPYILLTLHRAENTDDQRRLKVIISAMNELSKKYHILFSIHPRTRKIIESNQIALDFPTIDPVGYLEMLQLLKNASLIITDSGGLQKEAFFFQKYCLTIRDETEWTELVENGYNHLTGIDKEMIISLSEKYFGKEIDNPKNLYGNGKSANIICEELSKLGNKESMDW